MECRSTGFPCTALCDWSSIDSSISHSYRSEGITVVEMPFIGQCWFPCIPVWQGVAINTFFYAAIGWLMWRSVGFTRRRVRVFRQQCPSCAYSRTGLSAHIPCPECGEPAAR
jgi:hypothetical protein